MTATDALHITVPPAPPEALLKPLPPPPPTTRSATEEQSGGATKVEDEVNVKMGKDGGGEGHGGLGEGGGLGNGGGGLGGKTHSCTQRRQQMRWKQGDTAEPPAQDVPEPAQLIRDGEVGPVSM